MGQSNNIRGFGGDPKNITIFGELAGSFSVSAQMASPLSKDRIEKAIGESGAAFYSSGLSFEPREEREQRRTPNSQRALCMRRRWLSFETFLLEDLIKAASAKTTPPPPRFGPDIELGWFLPDSVPNIDAAGKQAHIPLIAGWNKDEVRAEVLHADPKVTALDIQSAGQGGVRRKR